MYIDNMKQIFHIVYESKINKDLFHIANYIRTWNVSQNYLAR